MEIERLKKGDYIGIVCPSHIASRDRHKRSATVLEQLGFRVKFGENVYRDTHGYLASEIERADDFNAMISDESVKMVLFGGGEGGNELLPHIDYENIRRHPKFICGFSDGTTILNAVHSMTGLATYYGQGPGMFNDLRYYDFLHFSANFVDGVSGEFIKNYDWKTLRGGECKGKLIGGYARNFALLLGGGYFKYDKNEKYVLFLEDHEKFSVVAEVSSYISHIEQSGFIENIAGLIFGHYSENVPDDLLKRLERFGEKRGVPVVYCDDFGHGTSHAILPIGQSAHLDADAQKMLFI